MKNIIPIIIIEFNSFDRTVKYIKDFIDKVISNDDFSFIVIDNAENVDNYINLMQKIKNEFSFYEIIEPINNFNDQRISQNIELNVSYNNKKFDIILAKSKENYGFAIGNNIGASIAGQLYCSEYIIFSNSDIQFKNESFNLSKILNIMKSNKGIGLAGPKIVGLDNKDQTPCCQKSLWERWNKQSIFFPINLYFAKNILNKSDDVLFLEKDSFVYRVIGAFMIFDFKAFNNIKMFDENTFLYAEELIIAEKLKKLGYKTYYYNSEVLIHEQGGTTKKVFNISNKFKTRFKSEIYYYQNYMNVRKEVIFLSKVLFNIFLIKLKFYCFLIRIIKYFIR